MQGPKILQLVTSLEDLHIEQLADLALQLIEKKSSAFDPKKFEDHYGTALKQLVQEKLKGHKIIAHHEERPQGSNVVDLMDALKRSLKGGAEKAQPPKSPNKRSDTSKKRAPKVV